jgi:hypothetical protein
LHSGTTGGIAKVYLIPSQVAVDLSPLTIILNIQIAVYFCSSKAIYTSQEKNKDWVPVFPSDYRESIWCTSPFLVWGRVTNFFSS